MPDLRNVNADFYKPYFTVLEYFRYTGINLFDETNFWMFKFKYLHIITFIIFMTMSMCHFHFLIEKLYVGSDLLDLSSDMSFCFNSMEAIFLFLYFCIFKSRMQKFVFKLEKEWRVDSVLLSQVIILKQKEMHAFDRKNYIFLKTIQVYRNLYMAYPVLVTVVKKYIYGQEALFTPLIGFTMPFEYKDNTLKFLCVYLIEFIDVTILSATLNCALLILIVSMNQLKILFILLQEDFKEIIQSNDKDVDIKLKLTIQRHSILTGLLGEIGSAFGSYFAVHLFFLTFTVCFYAIAAKIYKRLEDIKNVLIALIISGSAFYSCLQGQYLTESALNIAAAVYESPWEALSIKNKKMVLFTMLRSQQASYIQSTCFVDISTNTFIKIMKTTWSLISLINILYEK